MKISYGPPGHRGVTHLMAIGAAELDDQHTQQVDQAVGRLLMGAIAVTALGFFLGSSAMRTAGAGGAATLWMLRSMTRAKRVVEVSQPAP